MKEPAHHLRKAIIDDLFGNVVINQSIVQIYNKVPHNAPEPFIKVYTLSSGESEFNRNSKMVDTVLRIECVTAFDTVAGGELQVNQMVSQIYDRLRVSPENYLDLSAEGLYIYSMSIGQTQYFEEYTDGKIYHRAVISVEIKTNEQ